MILNLQFIDSVQNKKFVKSNLALRDHLLNGKRVFLFESVSKGYVKFKCEAEVFDADYFEEYLVYVSVMHYI